MREVGFEPTKHFASDLKSDPFDQTRVLMLDFYDKILFLTGLLEVINLTPPAGLEPATYRLTAERSAN